MHLLVATAGVLPPDPVADFAELLIGETGSVTVMSVVTAPREFLEDLVTEPWRPFDDSDAQNGQPPADESEIDRYVNERGSRLVAPVVAALASRGFEANTVFVEADEAADAIVNVADQINAGAIVMGATRRLFTESAWTSVSMKVTADSKLPVLLIPAPSRVVAENEEFNMGEYVDPSEDDK